jgi:hypothetical protein
MSDNNSKYTISKLFSLSTTIVGCATIMAAPCFFKFSTIAVAYGLLLACAAIASIFFFIGLNGFAYVAESVQKPDSPMLGATTVYVSSITAFIVGAIFTLKMIKYIAASQLNINLDWLAI